MCGVEPSVGTLSTRIVTRGGPSESHDRRRERMAVMVLSKCLPLFVAGTDWWTEIESEVGNELLNAC